MFFLPIFTKPMLTSCYISSIIFLSRLLFLQTTQSGDTVILKDNVVYAVKHKNLKKSDSMTRRAFSHLNLCVRKTDLLLRNISNNDLIQGVAVIDSIEEYQEYFTQNIAVRSCN